MSLFWKRGYDGTSVDMLCRSTGMPRASLYQLYGGKEGLFLSAVEHYAKARIAPLFEALGPTGTLAKDMRHFFEKVIGLASGTKDPLGCLISCVLADAAGKNPRFRKELESRLALLEARLAERIRLSGQRDVASEDLAMLLASVARGIMVRARSGASAAELSTIARTATSVFIKE